MAQISMVDNSTIELITSPQIMTESFEDLGGKFVVKGVDDIAVWLKATRNLSDRIKLQIKCFRSKDDTSPFYTQIQVISSTEISISPELFTFTTASVDAVIPLGISNLAPFAQIEVMVDTVGATAATIDEAYISFSRS